MKPLLIHTVACTRTDGSISDKTVTSFYEKLDALHYTNQRCVSVAKAYPDSYSVHTLDDDMGHSVVDKDGDAMVLFEVKRGYVQ